MADRILSAQIGADISPAEKSLGTLAKLLNEITEASRAAVESRTKGISEEMVASVKALEHAKQALKNEISRNVSSDKEARQIYDGLLKAHNQYLRQREQAEKAFDAAEKTRNAQSLKDTQAEYAQREAAYQAYLNQEARLAKAAAQSEAQARRIGRIHGVLLRHHRDNALKLEVVPPALVHEYDRVAAAHRLVVHLGAGALQVRISPLDLL